jgi:hypothetical protein
MEIRLMLFQEIGFVSLIPIFQNARVDGTR